MKRPERYIECQIKIKPRFSEVDAMNIVWHGSFVQYLEDAREHLGQLHGMGYMDVYRTGFMLPVVNMNIDFKKAISYEDEIVVIARLHDTQAAKVYYTYEVRSAKDNRLFATAETTQVFTDRNGELQIIYPETHVSWKKTLNWERSE